MSRLDLVILADLHCVGRGEPECALAERRGGLALELVRRALREALRSGRPDAVVLLGDIVENGAAAAAEADLVAVRDALSEFKLPVFAVPGNHDGPAERVNRIFGTPQGVYQLNGVRLAVFDDSWGAGDICTRRTEALEVLAVRPPEEPLVAVQHNPVLPRIADAYPYNIRDEDRLAAAYAAAGVTLSLSGHYHGGVAPYQDHGVTYFTCPALCEAPFRFARARIEGRRVAELSVVELAPAGFGALFDAHMHTELAGCAEDITAAGIVERARDLGLGGAGVAEHADQLYFSRADWRKGDVLSGDLAALERSAAEGASRMAEYRRLATGLRAAGILAGLEAEPADDRPELAVLPEDRTGWDYIIGSIHRLPGMRTATAPPAESARAFLAAVERLLSGGADVLGHPFRIFQRARRPVPQELFRPVAELLSAHGAAAEINFHTNQPEPEFFALCLELGVKLAVGTDSHAMVEIGELRPHLEFLRSLGVGEERFGQVLWRPGPPGRPAGID